MRRKRKGWRISESAGPGLTGARRSTGPGNCSPCAAARACAFCGRNGRTFGQRAWETRSPADVIVRRLAQMPTLRMAEMGLSRALGSPNGAMQGAQFCGWKLHTRRSCDGKRRRQREVLQGRLMEFNRFSPRVHDSRVLQAKRMERHHHLAGLLNMQSGLVRGICSGQTEVCSSGTTCSHQDTIHIPGIELGFKRPVLFERHAVGGEYGAGWKKASLWQMCQLSAAWKCRCHAGWQRPPAHDFLSREHGRGKVLASGAVCDGGTWT